MSKSLDHIDRPGTEKQFSRLANDVNLRANHEGVQAIGEWFCASLLGGLASPAVVRNFYFLLSALPLRSVVRSPTFEVQGSVFPL